MLMYVSDQSRSYFSGLCVLTQSQVEVSYSTLLVHLAQGRHIFICMPIWVLVHFYPCSFSAKMKEERRQKVTREAAGSLIRFLFVAFLPQIHFSFSLCHTTGKHSTRAGKIRRGERPATDKRRDAAAEARWI